MAVDAAMLFLSFSIGLAAISASLLAYLYFDDIFNPVTVFTPAWFLPYSLYLLYPYPASVQPRLSALAHATILFSGVAFLLGFVITSPTPNDTLGEFRTFPHSRLVIALGLGAMFAVSVAAAYLQFRGAGGLPTLLSDPDTFGRMFYHGPVLDDVFNLIFIAGFLAVVYLKPDLPFIALLAVVSTALAFAVLTFGRQQLVLVGMLILVGVHYYHRRFRFLDAVVMFGVMVAGGVAAIAVVPRGLTGGVVGRAGIIIHPVVTQLYWYVAMGLQNVESAVSNIPPIHFNGFAHSLEFLWTVTGTRSAFGLDSGVGASAVANRQFFGLFPTWTAPIPFYLDAGVIGAILGMGVVGFGTAKLYGWMRSTRRISLVFAYGLAVVALVLVFFNNLFTRPNLWKLLIQFGLLIIVMNLTEKTISRFQDVWAMDAPAAIENSHTYKIYRRVRDTFEVAWEHSYFVGLVKSWNGWTGLRAAWENSFFVNLVRLR